jgi:hypothetical protein
MLALAGCADLDFRETSSEVIGGAPTPAGKFPGVGALMYDFGDGMPQAGCTGTLIAPDAVLTAAHCVDPALTGGAMPVGFTLALDTTSGTPAITPAKQTFKHDSFTADVMPMDGQLGQFFDVGIMLLAQPITEVAPVPMPRPEDAPELVANLDMQIAGYGVTSNDSFEGGVLFDAQTKLISLNDSELQVGMGLPQPQNCFGDSGGPGFATVGGTRRVIGIVSRSFSGGECTMGGIDTRVDFYLDFVHAKVPQGIPCDSGMSEACPVGGGGDDDDSGCCSTSSRANPGSVLLAFALGLLLFRRRRA